MDPEFDMADMLSRTLQVRCSACGTDNPPRSVTCSHCGASISVEEDPAEMSIAESGAEQVLVEGKVPLEQSKNYRALHRAANGILDGSMSDEDYKRAVRKLKFIADTGLRLVDSEVVAHKFEDVTAEQKKLSDEMRVAFVRLQEGLQRMEDYLLTRNAEDVREGCALADSGFVLIDQIEDRALAMGG